VPSIFLNQWGGNHIPAKNSNSPSLKGTHRKMVGPLIQNQKTCMRINSASTTLSTSYEQPFTNENQTHRKKQNKHN